MIRYHCKTCNINVNQSECSICGKDSIIKLRDDMRNEIEKLGFSRNSISAIEVSDFRFKVKLKAWRELITNDTKYKRDMGPIEFTGGSIYALTVNLKW